MEITELLDDVVKDIHDSNFEVQRLISFGVTVKNLRLNHLLEDLERQRTTCAVRATCLMLYAIQFLEEMSSVVNKPMRLSDMERYNMRKQLMIRLEDEKNCRDILRMGPQAFQDLCEKLRNTGRIKDSRWVTVEEQVAKFLHILAHNVKTRTMCFYFHRSGETINRHFHNVLRAMVSLEAEFFVQPSGSEVPAQIFYNSRFYPYFKDCVGAIDGTHVRAKVPREEVARFRGRKDYPTQNVFAACSFDMKFSYVLAGWEGSASDSRILKNALSREDNLIIPQGKFYLGDAGFPLMRGLLTPYRGVRYHLKEYSSRAPQNEKEIFNHRHASLRNVIERIFGVLKKRFPIVASGTEPYYSFQTMTDIVIACCVLHNFLMGVDPDENLIAEVDRDLLLNPPDHSEDTSNHGQEEEYRQGALVRDSIACQMWHDYQSGA